MPLSGDREDDVLAALALALTAAAQLSRPGPHRGPGPARMALAWRGTPLLRADGEPGAGDDARREPPWSLLPMPLRRSPRRPLVLALCAGAAWVGARDRRRPLFRRRRFRTFASRWWFSRWSAAGGLPRRGRCSRCVREQLAYRSLLGIAPACSPQGSARLESAAVSVLADDVPAPRRRAATRSAATVARAAALGHPGPSGLWLRRRRELGALLLARDGRGGADRHPVNTLTRQLRPPGFPPLSALGGPLPGAERQDGVPADLRGRGKAHIAVVAAALLLLLAQTLPRGRGRSRLEGAICRVGPTCSRGASPAPRPSRRVPRCSAPPGPFRIGADTLLRAWRPAPRAVRSRRIPTRRCPPPSPSTDVARRRPLWPCRRRRSRALGPARKARRRSRPAPPFDPFTSVADLSRGEPARPCLLSPGVLAGPRDPGCNACSWTSPPRAGRSRARTRSWTPCASSCRRNSRHRAAVVLTSHDPSRSRALLGDRAASDLADHVFLDSATERRTRSRCASILTAAGGNRAAGPARYSPTSKRCSRRATGRPAKLLRTATPEGIRVLRGRTPNQRAGAMPTRLPANATASSRDGDADRRNLGGRAGAGMSGSTWTCRSRPPRPM